MEIYLLRHGETDYNAQRRYQGRKTDLPLSAQGAAALRPLELTPAPAVVYTSPLRRARQTAALLFPAAALEPVSGLEEMDFGPFEGHTYAELAQDAAYTAWLDSGGEAPIPGGESRAAFCARTCAAFAALVDRALAQGCPQLVVVAHGGTQMAVLAQYAVPHRDYYEWNAPLGGGYILETDADEWAMQRIFHLKGTVEVSPC